MGMEKGTNLPTTDSRVRILVVDDHPNTANMLARAIARMGSNVEVFAATSGSEALKRVQDEAADILITDMIMPEMTGLELIEKLQTHPAGRPTFSYLMTAYDVPGLKVTARRLKVKEVISKPVHPSRVCQIISDAMDEMQHSQPDQREVVPQKQFNILIADDRPDNLVLLGRYLNNEGYGFIKASDGLETLQKIRTELPDLVLLDVNMPHKDGFTVLQEIRSDPAVRHIPVIILTAARLDSIDIQSGLNLGADDYVTKPFDRRELLARIRTKLRVKEAEDVIRRRNRELQLLPEISKELSVRLNLSELSDIVLRRTVETLGAEEGHLILLNPRSPVHKEYRVSVSETVDSHNQIPALNHLLKYMEENREGILIQNTREDERWQTPDNEPAHSVVIAPMFGQMDLIGFLVLVHEQVGYFTIDHQSLLQAIAGQASVAVENARLYTNMAQEKQKLDAILQSAANAILMFDEDGCLSMLNPAAEALFNNNLATVGLPLARGQGYDMLIDALEETYTSGAAHSTELKWHDYRTFTALFTPIDKGGCVVALQDVTHFKQLEKVKDEFVATASHDLRNPITTIKGYSQLLMLSKQLDDSQLDFIKRIHHASIHMAELVENMLSLAKMDLSARLDIKELDISTLFMEIADEFKPQAEAKQQVIKVEKTAASSMVRGDTFHLRQVFRNLIGNAIKYTPEFGMITLSVEQSGSNVKISVKDTGYGIPAADLPNLFKRFYRVRNNGHDHIEGNGLGLAIVKSIIEQHGGTVTVESEPGKGSCFIANLPLFQMKETIQAD